MNKPLRRDEQFVAAAIADHFNATWKAGDNPPDAHLRLKDREVSLEITALEQYVVDEKRGGYKPRRSEDTTAVLLARELDTNLRTHIPDGMLVILTMNSPIAKPRKTKAALARLISDHLKLPADMVDIEKDIEGNKIGIRITAYTDPRKILCVVRNMKSDPKIINNAWCMLEERIKTKAKKCRRIGQEIWLGLLDNYTLADAATYRQAFACFSVEHPFSKILLVSNDGEVETLYSRGGAQ